MSKAISKFEFVNIEFFSTPWAANHFQLQTLGSNVLVNFVWRFGPIHLLARKFPFSEQIFVSEFVWGQLKQTISMRIFLFSAFDVF